MSVLNSQSWEDWGRDLPSASDGPRDDGSEGSQQNPSPDQGNSPTGEKRDGPRTSEVRFEASDKNKRGNVENGQMKRKRGRPRLKARDDEEGIRVCVSTLHISETDTVDILTILPSNVGLKYAVHSKRTG